MEKEERQQCRSFYLIFIPGTIICLAAHMHNHPLEPMPASGEQL